MTSPVEEVDRPSAPRGKKGASRHRSEGNFSFTTTSRLTGVVFRWLDQRTATQIVT